MKDQPLPVSQAYLPSLFGSGQARRTAARREIIHLQVRIAELVEPRTPPENVDPEFWWTERKYLERRVAELRQVVEEPLA